MPLGGAVTHWYIFLSFPHHLSSSPDIRLGKEAGQPDRSAIHIRSAKIIQPVSASTIHLINHVISYFTFFLLKFNNPNHFQKKKKFYRFLIEAWSREICTLRWVLRSLWCSLKGQLAELIEPQRNRFNQEGGSHQIGIC